MKTAGRIARLLAIFLASGVAMAAPDQQLSQHLAQAVVENDVTLVRRLIGEGAELQESLFGATALHLAAEYGRPEITQLLLEQGAEVDAVDNLGRTPLLWAAYNQHSDVVRLLLSRGADVNREDPSRFRGPADDSPYPTSLDYAIHRGDLKLCRMFAEAGAKIHKKDSTRLSRAVASGNPEVLAWLLDRGVDPTAQSEEAASAFSAAGMSENAEMISILVKKSRNAAALKILLNEALQYAAENGRTSVVRFLLENTKVDLNRQVETSYGGISRLPDRKEKFPGYTALSRAVENGHDEIVRALLEKGAHVTGRTRSGASVLSFVISQDRADLFELFMKFNPSLEEVDIDERTALMTAAMRNKLEIARVLIERGAQLDKHNRDGATAVMLAAEAGAIPVLEYLLAKGARIDAQGEDGSNALSYAVNGCHRDVCSLLLAKGADPNVVQEKTGRTVLHLAAQKPCAPAIKALLAGGASTQVRDRAGNTPLDLARLSGDPESIELLSAGRAP